HLEHDVGGAPEPARVRFDLGAGLPVRVVGERGIRAGAALDRDVIAELRQLRDRFGGRRNAAFADVNFLWNTDLHQNPLRRVPSSPLSAEVDASSPGFQPTVLRMRQHWWTRGLRRKSSSMVSAVM